MGIIFLDILLCIFRPSNRIFDGASENLFFSSMLTNLVSLFSGIIGLIRIIIKRKETSGTIRAIIAIILSLTLLAVVIPAIIHVRSPDLVICKGNLYCIRKAFLKYAQNNQGKYPNADKWCDEIIEYLDATAKKHFLCPTALQHKDKGPCHYAMNPNCEPNSPNDIVLLFETKGGWNQHGGPELLTFDNHVIKLNNHTLKGCCIAFNDGRVKFIEPNEVDKLKWKTEANEVDQPAL